MCDGGCRGAVERYDPNEALDITFAVCTFRLRRSDLLKKRDEGFPNSVLACAVQRLGEVRVDAPVLVLCPRYESGQGDETLDCRRRFDGLALFRVLAKLDDEVDGPVQLLNLAQVGRVAVELPFHTLAVPPLRYRQDDAQKLFEVKVCGDDTFKRRNVGPRSCLPSDQLVDFECQPAG